MPRPVLFGQPSYLHVRAIAFALAEKGVAYGLSPRLERPRPVENGNVVELSNSDEPVLEYDGFVVTGAETILRFVDEALPGPSLQPVAPRQRARMNRALEIHFGDAVPILSGKVVARSLAAAFGIEWVDPILPDGIAAQARRCVARLEHVLDDGPFLAGDMITLADIGLAPVFANLMPLPDAEIILSPGSPLRLWWQRISGRESFQATRTKHNLWPEP